MGSFSPQAAARTYWSTLARLNGGILALGEGQKVIYELQTARRTGKISAINVKLAA
jgi:hypothetical protein